ncbi:hypothetical protein [Gulosibacter sediminis]|uniref:hypothetical protein n=1 Tax=Gulosibacter sediminis TaxID=1729695 RepID=UPI001F16584B|nr:hypothetical protein [Gulosibacter sediminis]
MAIDHGVRPSCVARIAAVTISESPGRNGKSTPDSMKMMIPMPMSTQGPSAGSKVSGSRMSRIAK